MGIFKDADRAWHKKADVRSEPIVLTREQWNRIQRAEPAPPALTIEEANILRINQAMPPILKLRRLCQAHLARVDRKRWARLQKDFAWAKNTLYDQLGMNPEDTRWIL
jgi:hypothetical protein